MRDVFAVVSGLVFGIGLIASGMTDPAKVKGFLDVAGAWDPSLALVMAGAIAVGCVGFRAGRGRAASWTGVPMELPTSRVIDARLVAGGVVFGAGWGLAGFCPGPALVALGAGVPDAAWFVGAMVVGMLLHDRFLARG